MKPILLVLALAALASAQTDPTAGTTCVFAEVQNLEAECMSELTGILSGLSTNFDATQFCASQCAADIRAIYDGCGLTGSQNLVSLVCGGGGVLPGLPDIGCALTAFQDSTECFTLLSGDPTAFCTSDCATTLSDKFTTCQYTGDQNPIQLLCSGTSNITGPNPVCAAGRLSTLSNCALELVTTPTIFCSGQCAQSVYIAYDECGFTGINNPVSLVCSQPVSVQDPICLSNRLQNLGGCLNTFLSNLTTFCDSACSDALASAYLDCGYGTVVSDVCSSGAFSGDEVCLATKLQALDSCTPDVFNNPVEFCESSCVDLISDAYVDCGVPVFQSPSYTLCLNAPSSGPDPICLAERQANLQSCINTFFTAPTTFCSSPCYPQLRDAYTDCGYTGFNNPFQTCIDPSPEDPICVARRLLDVEECFNSILTNLTYFCNSPCRDQVSQAYEGCGYFNQSNPANICFLAQPGTGTEVDLCLATELQNVEGCLTGFTSNPYSFCTTECANTTRYIYDSCGYTTLYGYNPVDAVCTDPSSPGAIGPDTFCLVYGLQNQTECLFSLLTNSTGFCSSNCFYQVSNAYDQCGFSGASNPVVISCSAPTNQDPICLSTRLQSPEVTTCSAQLLTDRGTFCSSDCKDIISNAYAECGFAYADPAGAVCNGNMPNPTDTCLSESTVYQDCLAEIALDPNSFCTSNCASNLEALFQTCGLRATDNPAAALCQGLVPDMPGQPNPTCLFNGLTNLQDCVAQISTDPANFCNSPCRYDLSTAYNECGYPSISNPVTLLCDATPTNTGDLTCLNASLSEIQDCVVELATQPADICNSQCSLDLSDAYSSCGFTDTSNPINLACGGGFPGQDPNCIAGKLLTQNDCTSNLKNDDFCGSECETELRTAFSECGFTGTTNPVAILCSGAPSGSPNTICLGVQLQLHQECISTLLSNPRDVCTTDNNCANVLQDAYDMCGYTDTQNPIGSSPCGRIGNGAPPLQAMPVVALTLLLLVVAALLF